MAIYAVGFFMDGKMVAVDGVEFMHLKNALRQLDGLKKERFFKKAGVEMRVVQILVKDKYGCVLRVKDVKL